MYSLIQTRIIPHTVIKDHFQTFGYAPNSTTPGIWQHKKNVIDFTLVLGKFGISYSRKQDEYHLINSLTEICAVTQD